MHKLPSRHVNVTSTFTNSSLIMIQNVFHSLACLLETISILHILNARRLSLKTKMLWRGGQIQGYWAWLVIFLRYHPVADKLCQSLSQTLAQGPCLRKSWLRYRHLSFYSICLERNSWRTERKLFTASCKYNCIVLTVERLGLDLTGSMQQVTPVGN